MNTSSNPVEGCFGESFEVTFWRDRVVQGWAEVVDHPTCLHKFRILPGESASQAYQAQVPKVPVGSAILFGWVQVVDPTRCDQYGCDRARLKAATVASVQVREP